MQMFFAVLLFALQLRKGLFLHYKENHEPRVCRLYPTRQRQYHGSNQWCVLTRRGCRLQSVVDASRGGMGRPRWLRPSTCGPQMFWDWLHGPGGAGAEGSSGQTFSCGTRSVDRPSTDRARCEGQKWHHPPPVPRARAFLRKVLGTGCLGWPAHPCRRPPAGQTITPPSRRRFRKNSKFHGSVTVQNSTPRRCMRKGRGSKGAWPEWKFTAK